MPLCPPRLLVPPLASLHPRLSPSGGTLAETQESKDATGRCCWKPQRGHLVSAYLHLHPDLSPPDAADASGKVEPSGWQRPRDVGGYRRGGCGEAHQLLGVLWRRWRGRRLSETGVGRGYGHARQTRVLQTLTATWADWLPIIGPRSEMRGGRSAATRRQDALSRASS